MGGGTIHWDTAPSCARILEALECRGPLLTTEIAPVVYVSLGTVKQRCLLLLEHHLIHVEDWVRFSGRYSPVYALGPCKSKPRPVMTATSNADKHRRRRERLVAAYGAKLAGRMLHPGKYGVSVISMDGEVIYRKGGK